MRKADGKEGKKECDRAEGTDIPTLKPIKPKVRLHLQSGMKTTRQNSKIILFVYQLEEKGVYISVCKVLTA
ncbi:MAG: hypothetical protein ATN36_08515 [Epulopiscium sp. Nele67-Bin005]|nr:MAG: hypothetical protein ATN36_08515 [Epulopiscium sp. Nele67-Bin005]